MKNKVAQSVVHRNLSNGLLPILKPVKGNIETFTVSAKNSAMLNWLGGVNVRAKPGRLEGPIHTCLGIQNESAEKNEPQILKQLTVIATC